MTMLMKLFDRNGNDRNTAHSAHVGAAHAGAAHAGVDAECAVVVVVRLASWEEGVEVFVGFFVSFWTIEVATVRAFPGSSG
jgi:hypothetical protein